MSFHRCFAVLAFTLTCALPLSAHAQEDDGEPQTQPTIDAALKNLAQKYGSAAVALQGYLLAHSISAGSQLEASAAITGHETRNGHQYLVFDIDSGIAYRIEDVATRQQLSLIWTEVIDPSLRKASLSNLTEEGLVLRIRSYRGQFADRIALVRERDKGRLQTVVTTFVLPFDAIRAFVAGQLSPNELGKRGAVEIDGTATELEIIPTPVPTEEPTAVP